MSVFLIDRIGLLHCWENDNIEPKRSGINIFTPECDLLIQENVGDFLYFLGLDEESIQELYKGYTVRYPVRFR